MMIPIFKCELCGHTDKQHEGPRFFYGFVVTKVKGAVTIQYCPEPKEGAKHICSMCREQLSQLEG